MENETLTDHFIKKQQIGSSLDTPYHENTKDTSNNTTPQPYLKNESKPLIITWNPNKDQQESPDVSDYNDYKFDHALVDLQKKVTLDHSTLKMSLQDQDVFN